MSAVKKERTNQELGLLLDALTLAKFLREQGTNAPVIAGGAIRDLVLNKKISDVDIFVKGDRYKIEKILSRVYSITSLGEGTEYDNGVIEDVFSVPFTNGEVQVIILSVPPTLYVNAYFPVNLSKIKYNTVTHKLIASPEFISGVKKKKLILTETCSDDYVAKLVNKFPDYIIEDQRALSFARVPSYRGSHL